MAASGWCEYRYYLQSTQVKTAGDNQIALPEGEVYNTQVWRKAEFQLTDEMQRQLREALQAADLFNLDDNYINERIMDGTQWIVRLRSGGKEKLIYCSNSFPERLCTLSRIIREQIMVPHRLELLTASRIEGDHYSPEEGAWLEDIDK